MMAAMRKRWLAQHTESLEDNTHASDRAGTITAMSKATRLMMQSGILGFGAYLAVLQEITPGTMIAASRAADGKLGACTSSKLWLHKNVSGDEAGQKSKRRELARRRDGLGTAPTRDKLLAVDRPLDMSRTVVNVLGDQLAAKLSFWHFHGKEGAKHKLNA